MLKNIVSGILFGWIPEWVWGLINFWPYIFWSTAAVIAIGVFYKVYRFGGWPALAAALGVSGLGVGYFLGSKKVSPKVENKKARRPSVNRKSRETIFDVWERHNRNG